jgi:predicted component of type VI protein secretion system
VAPNPKQPGDVASSVKVLERYLQSYPEDAAICVKLLHLYTVQRAQVKDEAQRQALAKKIAAKRQILAVLLPELGLEGDHNEGKPL